MTHVNNLRVIKFAKVVLGRSVVSILQKCTNVEDLEFHNIILDVRDPIESSYQLELLNLKSITFSDPTQFGPDAQRGAETLFQFLNSIGYGQLQKVKFW